ncbi:hypothetical protein FB451DRAFT_1179309 [Mycena latifolia]|nr:hypothetical protein FB451DRAFT_1179309 [Mycena latifolia]
MAQGLWKVNRFQAKALDLSNQHGQLGVVPELAIGQISVKESYGNVTLPVQLPALPALTPDTCSALAKVVYVSKRPCRHVSISGTAAADREPLGDERPKKIIVIQRHYLTLVVNAAHHKASSPNSQPAPVGC